METMQKSRANPWRALPDEKICRRAASDLAEGLYECRIDFPRECRYALPVNKAFYCLLPQGKQQQAPHVDEPPTQRRPALSVPDSQASAPAVVHTRASLMRLDAALAALGVAQPSRLPEDIGFNDYVERLIRAHGIAGRNRQGITDLVAAAERITADQFSDALAQQRNDDRDLADVLVERGLLTERERTFVWVFQLPSPPSASS